LFLDGDGVFVKLKIVAARRAMWQLGKSDVELFAAYFGVVITAGATLFQTIYDFVIGVLECSELEATEIVHQRLIDMRRGSNFDDEILTIDEAVEVLDHRDHKKLRTTQDDCKKQQTVVQQFCSELMAKKVRVRLAAAAAVPAPKKKAKKGAAPPAPHHGVATFILPQPRDIQHKDANSFKPPGSSIWRGITKNCWCGHMPPHDRCSGTFKEHGSDVAALMSVLHKLWTQWCKNTSTLWPDCPCANIDVITSACTIPGFVTTVAPVVGGASSSTDVVIVPA
jgi:hypothetical protein